MEGGKWRARGTSREWAKGGGRGRLEGSKRGRRPFHAEDGCRGGVQLREEVQEVAAFCPRTLDPPLEGSIIPSCIQGGESSQLRWKEGKPIIVSCSFSGGGGDPAPSEKCSPSEKETYSCGKFGKG